MLGLKTLPIESTPLQEAPAAAEPVPKASDPPPALPAKTKLPVKKYPSFGKGAAAPKAKSKPDLKRAKVINDDAPDDGSKAPPIVAVSNPKLAKKSVKASPTGAAVPKRPPNAYFRFVQSKRSEYQSANPDLKTGALSKALGEAWKALSDEEKQPFVDASASALEGYTLELATLGLSHAPRQFKAAKKAASRAKTPFQLFSEERHPIIRCDHPKASNTEIASLLSQSWKSLPEEDRSVFEAMSKDLKVKVSSSAAATTKGRKRRAPSPQNESADEGVDDDTPQGAEQEKEEGEEADKFHEENEADWIANPAAYIISESADKTSYLVARCGLPLSEAVLVDAQKAKMARLNAQHTYDRPSPVTLDLILEHQGFCASFWQEVALRKESGGIALDLDCLSANSPLEICSLMGLLRENGLEMEKCGKNDVMMKVPLLGTCRVVQRILDSERAQKRELSKRLEAALEALKQRGITIEP